MSWVIDIIGLIPGIAKLLEQFMGAKVVPSIDFSEMREHHMILTEFLDRTADGGVDQRDGSNVKQEHIWNFELVLHNLSQTQKARGVKVESCVDSVSLKESKAAQIDSDSQISISGEVRYNVTEPRDRGIENRMTPFVPWMIFVVSYFSKNPTKRTFVVYVGSPAVQKVFQGNNREKCTSRANKWITKQGKK